MLSQNISQRQFNGYYLKPLYGINFPHTLLGNGNGWNTPMKLAKKCTDSDEILCPNISCYLLMSMQETVAVEGISNPYTVELRYKGLVHWMILEQHTSDITYSRLAKYVIKKFHCKCILLVNVFYKPMTFPPKFVHS